MSSQKSQLPVICELARPLGPKISSFVIFLGFSGADLWQIGQLRETHKLPEPS